MRYVWRTDRYADLPVGEWSRFVDADGDGDQDMFSEAPYSFIRWYRNDGTATSARWVVGADSLRDPAGGPPVAAVRLPPGPFPMTFEVTSANLIAMGGARPVPATLDLSVRIDTDGNPMTRTDAEPSFMAKAVAKGTSGIDAALH